MVDRTINDHSLLQILLHVFVLILILACENVSDHNKKESGFSDQVEKKDHLIQITQPQANAVVDSFVVIKGKARGYWFFEGDFPIELKNARGKKVVETYISASDEWMTKEFVEFEKLVFLPDSLNGSFRLVLRKANPTGLPQHSDSLIIPIRIEK